MKQKGLKKIVESPEEVLRYVTLYDRMRQQVQAGNSVSDVIKAAELLLADCMNQRKEAGEKITDKDYMNIANEVWGFGVTIIKIKGK